MTAPLLAPAAGGMHASWSSGQLAWYPSSSSSGGSETSTWHQPALDKTGTAPPQGEAA